jgi:hypothetical protein
MAKLAATVEVVVRVSFQMMNLENILSMILSFLLRLWQWMLEQRFPGGSGRQTWTPVPLSATG